MTAGEGHNQTAPAEDAVLALNIAKMLAADILFAGAKDDRKAIAKHVETKGVNLKAYAWADKIIKSGNVVGAVALIEDTLKILKIRGRPVSTSQIELFQTEDDATPSVDKATEHGRYCGIMGFDMEANPYGPVGEVGQAWISAWHGGCDERKLILSLEPAEGSELIKGSDEGNPFERGDPFEDDAPALQAAE